MGIDIGGMGIVQSGGGMVLNTALTFNSAGQGTANPYCGYAGFKSAGTYYYASPTGWEVNAAYWQSSSPANGSFTCPVAGIYAVGYDAIHRGGSNVPTGQNCYGYACWAKNGVQTYWVHWNMSPTNYWNTGGCSALFQCQAGDTLALFINYPPSSYGPNVHAQNYGAYPDNHQSVWCKLVG